MDFSTSKTENLFLQMIREFAEKEVKPLAAAVDEEERFPEETVKKMAALGMMGIPFPKEYGGAGGNNQLYSMAVEELSRVCATTGVIVSAHTSLCASPIYEFGNEEQRTECRHGRFGTANDGCEGRGALCAQRLQNFYYQCCLCTRLHCHGHDR